MNGNITYNLNNNNNGKAKEYYNDGKLLFEGEYLNGKRNGIGKEYYTNGKLKFVGEYLNGKRNGKGKEYYNYDYFLKFEGIYLNDRKWSGKGYNTKYNITYELKDGKGLIKEYDYNDKLYFECEYSNGHILEK